VGRVLIGKPYASDGHGKLAWFAGWGKALPTAHPGLTLDETRDELAADQGIKVHRASIGDWLKRLGLSHKENAARIAVEGKISDCA